MFCNYWSCTNTFFSLTVEPTNTGQLTVIGGGVVIAFGFAVVIGELSLALVTDLTTVTFIFQSLAL